MFAQMRLPGVAWLAVVLLACSAIGDDANWPRWRGPHENGHTTDTNLPVKWSAENVVWKTQLPGIGQSSPIIWGDRIFLTSALEQGKERLVFCVDRKSGKIVWQQSAWKGQPEPVACAERLGFGDCVTDGEIVVAFFGRGGHARLYRRREAGVVARSGPVREPVGRRRVPDHGR